MIGGEIYVVRVKNGKSLADGSPIPTFDVLVPAAVNGVGEQGIVLVIEPAPAELVADTGVQYWAKDFAFQTSICPAEKTTIPSAACFADLKEEYAPGH